MELTIENLIKIIVGVLVVAVITYGLFFFFKNNFIDFFKNMGSDNISKFIFSLLI